MNMINHLATRQGCRISVPSFVPSYDARVMSRVANARHMVEPVH